MPKSPTVTRSQTSGMSAGSMLRGQIAPAPYNDRYAKIFGSQLTPQAFTQVLSNAALGYMYFLADALDEIRERDTHLQSCLQKREMRVTSAEWEIRPPAGKGKQAQNIADWCKEKLLAIEASADLGRSFYDGLGDLLGGIYQGRGVLEAVWRQEGRFWYPEQLFFVHPRRIAYATNFVEHIWDAQGTNTSIYLPPESRWEDESRFGRFPGVPVSAFPAGKFVVHRPRVRGVYPTREGLGALVAWYALFKRADMRDWMALAEWAGRGLRVGTFSSGDMPDSPGRASPEDVAVLKQVIDDLSSSVSVVVPDTTKIDIHGMPTTNDVHEKLLFACNSEMSKAVLLETLTTEVGVAGGNRALGEVHDGIGSMLARNDAKQLEQTIRRDILRPMVIRSFGENAPVPEFHFCLEEPEDMDKMVARFKTMIVDVKLPMGVDYIYEQLGWEKPKPSDVLLMPTPEPVDPKSDSMSSLPTE